VYDSLGGKQQKSARGSLTTFAVATNTADTCFSTRKIRITALLDALPSYIGVTLAKKSNEFPFSGCGPVNICIGQLQIVFNCLASEPEQVSSRLPLVKPLAWTVELVIVLRGLGFRQ